MRPTTKTLRTDRRQNTMQAQTTKYHETMTVIIYSGDSDVDRHYSNDIPQSEQTLPDRPSKTLTSSQEKTKIDNKSDEK